VLLSPPAAETLPDIFQAQAYGRVGEVIIGVLLGHGPAHFGICPGIPVFAAGTEKNPA